MREHRTTDQKPSLEIPRDTESDELSLADVLAFAWYYWPFIAKTVIVCSLLGLLYVLTASPTYTATAELLIESSQQTTPTLSTAESTVALDTPQVESEIALLKSEQTIRRAAQLLEKGANGAIEEKDLAPSSTAASRPESRKLGGSADTTVLQPDNHELGNWLSRLLSSEPSPQTHNQEDARVRTLMKEIQENLEVRRIGLSYVLELSYRAGDAQTAASVVNAIGDAYVQDKIDRRARSAQQGGIWLEARIEEIRHLMNDAALDVQEFKARRDYRLVDRPEGAEALSGKAALPLNLEAGSNKNSGSDAQSSTSGAAGSRAAGTTSAAATAQEAPTLEELDSRAQTYRKIYESYLQAYTDTVQRQSYPGTSARVITRAEPPTRRSSPKRVLTVLASIVLGGFLGTGLALTMSSFDQTVRSSRQIRQKLGVPLLGQIDKQHQLHRLPFLSLFRKTSEDLKAGNFTIVQNDPLSSTARSLVATGIVMNDVAAAQNVHVIGILGIGSTINGAAVCSNLALLSARVGKRTLLIETDTAKPNLVSVLKADIRVDLKDVLDETLGQTEAVVAYKPEPMLSLLMARDYGTANFWTPDRTRKLLETLKEINNKYDAIYIHLPQSSEADHVSKVVDGVVLVSKAWATKMSELEPRVAHARIVGKPVIGVVISDLA